MEELMQKRYLFYFLMGAGLCMGITTAKQPVMATETVTTTETGNTTEAENTAEAAATETPEVVITTEADDAADEENAANAAGTADGTNATAAGNTEEKANAAAENGENSAATGAAGTADGANTTAADNTEEKANAAAKNGENSATTGAAGTADEANTTAADNTEEAVNAAAKNGENTAGADTTTNADDEEGTTTADEADTTTTDDAEEADTAAEEAAAAYADVSDDALYSGIQIDGDFSDWAAIDKVYDFNANLTEAAMIWDHDYVYLYLKEGVRHWDGWEMYEGNIHAATPYSNGNFCIETNTGYKSSVIVQGPNNGSVTAKVNDTYVDIAYKKHIYEIAIPVELLKGYNDKTSSLNLGTMGGWNDTPNYIMMGVSHWNPDAGTTGGGENQDKDDNNSDLYDKTTYIKYDYDFSDWDDYPHQTIDYSTGGSHGADAEGALYSDGEYLYGHIKYYGGYYPDIFGFFELAINEKYHRALMLNARAVDNDGNILWNYNTNDRKPGSYEFHIYGAETIDGGAWDTDYGVLYIELQKHGRLNAEFRLDQSKIAHYYKCDQTDIKSLDMRFIRIGYKWISCAGTSTGPILGMAISGFAVLGSMWFYNRKKKKGTAA